MQQSEPSMSGQLPPWQLCITLRTLEAAHYNQGGDEIPGLALGAHRTLTGVLSEEMEIS